MAGIFKSESGRKAVLERYSEFLDNWPVPNERRRVATRQGETFVLVCGPEDAPPLLLIHGALGNAAMWLFDVQAWAKDFRVYVVDVIGEPGLSASSRPPLDIEVYADWLEDVIKGLGLKKMFIAGESLGGWLALAYATRRPEAVARLALIVPGGLGNQFKFLYTVLPLMLLGPWGARKAGELIYGRAGPARSAAARDFFNFIAMITKNCRPRMEKLPIFSDEYLKRLTMPVYAILGGKDVLVNSDVTKRRLESLLPDVEIDYRPDSPHVIHNRAVHILAFFKGEMPVTR